MPDHTYSILHYTWRTIYSRTPLKGHAYYGESEISQSNTESGTDSGTDSVVQTETCTAPLTDRNKVKKCNLPCAVKVGNSNMVHC